MNRKVIIFFFLFYLFVISCKKEDDLGKFDSAIIESSSNPYKFKQITFTVNLYNASAGYANLPQIDSIKLKVNGKNWGTFSSQWIDTTGRTIKIVNDMKYYDLKINYLIIAPYMINTDKLQTAGDFVNYLNQRISLTPGEYLFEISEIKFKNIKNEWIVLKPQIYKDFKVVENTTSSFAGEISISLK